MPLESRACYGWFGLAGGASGEAEPKTHKSGWHFGEYLLITDQPDWMCPRVRITASDMDHAVKQAKKYCRDNKCNMVSFEEA